LRCVQLMQCDQHAIALPVPVAGDLFLADSETNRRRFASAWKQEGRRVAYFGSLKAAASPRSHPEIATWCFFTSDAEVDANMRVLDILRAVRDEADVGLIVKLHPRDFARRYKRYTEFQFLEEGELRRPELYARFTHAITFPSGVVQELLFAAKPFVLLRVGKHTVARSDIYLDDAYEGAVSDYSRVTDILHDPRSLDESFSQYRERFFRQHGIHGDLDRFIGALRRFGASDTCPDLTPAICDEDT
jgi:hypothetical protein